MPMSPEKSREFDRLLKRERRGEWRKLAPTLALIAIAMAVAVYLRLAHGSVWLSLIIGGGAILAKPTLLLMRYRQRKQQTERMEQQRAAKRRAKSGRA